MTRYLHPSKGVPGICDRCGRRVPHDTLQSEFVRGKDQSNGVCEECWDDDHPQNWVGSRAVSDSETVVDAQPEPDIVEHRSLFGFDPVFGQRCYIRDGIVRVETP